jgi:hypothetical protein
MAYTVPTTEQFVTRYPEFDPVDDALIGLVLTEAAGVVNESWIERDYPIAIMLLTAHMLVTEGAVERAAGKKSTMTSTGPIKSKTIGEVSVTYAGAGAGAGSALGDSAGLSATEYGKRFLALRRANFGGPMVA